MNPTISEIKEECRAVIALAEKATPGPWARVATFYISALGKCGIAEIKGPSSGLQSILNGDFIARSRHFTPAAAKALLTSIATLEDMHGKCEDQNCMTFAKLCPMCESAKDALESIRDAFA